MQFRSTKSKLPLVSYKEAVLSCLPDDGGLYVPDQTADIRQFLFQMNEKTSFNDMVAIVAPSILEGGLNPISASKVAASAYNFQPELIRLNEGLSLLNLYNGPTGIFKDFGIAFLSAILEEFINEGEKAMILSAARADTAVSMAHAFSGRKGISLVLLYPSGQIRGLDPSAFVQNGGNIIPIQVKGTFDDCQRLVVETINDREFSQRYKVTSANTINAGRLLPQVFYYLYAFIQLKNDLSEDLIFSVPSGNFGNLIAGLYAWKFGMPVNGFIAAMNINNSFGDYILGKTFKPKPLVSTNSPALDVSVPLNYERLASFYEEAPAVMRNMVYPSSIGDDLTLQTMEAVYKKYNVHIDPNTAVAFAAAQKVIAEREWNCNAHTVVLATGHPAREASLAEETAGTSIDVPRSLLALKKKCEPVAVISPQLETLESAIASCF
ncbi:MAG: threonine synthase [Treponema sp.]|jgi:threonine synthase|nr:threonine synthase [Treponema sp.]